MVLAMIDNVSQDGAGRQRLLRNLAEPVANQAPDQANEAFVERLQATMQQLNECQSDADVEALSMRVQTIMSEFIGMNEVFDRIGLLESMKQAELTLQADGQRTKGKRMKKMHALLETLPSKSPKKQLRILKKILVLSGKNLGVNIGKRGFCGYSICCNACCLTGSVLVIAGAAVAIGLLAGGGLDSADALEEAGSPEEETGSPEEEVGSPEEPTEEPEVEENEDEDEGSPLDDFRQDLEEELGQPIVPTEDPEENLDVFDEVTTTLQESDFASEGRSQEVLRSILWGNAEEIFDEETFFPNMVIVSNAVAVEVNAFLTESDFDSSRELILLRALLRLSNPTVNNNLVEHFGWSTQFDGLTGLVDRIYEDYSYGNIEAFATIVHGDSVYRAEALANVAWDHYQEHYDDTVKTVVRDIERLAVGEEDSDLTEFAQLARSETDSDQEQVRLIIEATETYFLTDAGLRFIDYDDSSYALHRHFLEETPEGKVQFILDLWDARQ